MGRPKSERTTIYRGTVYQTIKDAGKKVTDVSTKMGYEANYISNMFSKGYASVTAQTLTLLSLASGIEKDKLTAIPISPDGKRRAEEAIGKNITGDNAVLLQSVNLLTEQMTEGFRMLHGDIMRLIDTMDKYWKPDMPTIDRGQGEKE